MVGTIARGAYVLFVTTLVVAWVFSLTKPAPARRRTLSQQVWYVFA